MGTYLAVGSIAVEGIRTQRRGCRTLCNHHRQAATSVECSGTDARHAGGDDDFIDACHTAESIRTDTCHTIGDIDIGDGTEPVEGVLTDGSYTICNLKCCDCGCQTSPRQVGGISIVGHRTRGVNIIYPQRRVGIIAEYGGFTAGPTFIV